MLVSLPDLAPQLMPWKLSHSQRMCQSPDGTRFLSTPSDEVYQSLHQLVLLTLPYLAWTGSSIACVVHPLAVPVRQALLCFEDSSNILVQRLDSPVCDPSSSRA
jgi:hypothetical protein